MTPSREQPPSRSDSGHQQKHDAVVPRRVIALGLVIGLAFAALAVMGYRWVQPAALATLIELTGSAERDTAKDVGHWIPAEVGDEFVLGDGARTPESSVARFALSNGALLELKPASLVRFRRPTGGKGLHVDVAIGEADIQSGSGAVSIDTEFGALVLDANSSLRMRRTGSRLGLDVELGQLQLNERALQAGSHVELELGGIIVDLPATPATAESAKPEESPPPPPAPPELDQGDGIGRADLVVDAGENFVVHDPRPPTAIGIRLSKACDGPARLTAGSQKTDALERGALSFNAGTHAYEVRCLSAPDKVVARGNIRILKDAGTRQLPRFAPTANVATDGRRYTVLYQHRLPQVTVTWPTAPEASSYEVTIDGKTTRTSSPSYVLSSLKRGTHRVGFKAATEPARASRVSTIDVVYDTQAPAARVSEPSLDFTRGQQVTVSGQALSGWDVSVDGKPLSVDAKQNFSVNLEGDAPIPIAFSHPGRETHYYLRRPKPSQ